MTPHQAATAPARDIATPTKDYPARVMICDDSAVIRAAIGRILETDPAVTIVARASNGQAALDAQKLHDIDVVVLDVEMPVMDGLAALPRLLAADPGLRVIMASALTTPGADIALHALRLGAADYIANPSAMQVEGDTRFGTELIEKVKGLARLRRATRILPEPSALGATACAPRTATPPPQGSPFVLQPRPKRSPLLLAIGSSTGGPNALFALIQGLAGKIPVPVVLTQHMPAPFTPILADHIDKLGVLRCTEAHDGARLVAAEILLAPGDRHMLVDRDAYGLFVRLTDTPAVNYCRPAVDPMLHSACEATGGRVLAVILTGMGHDGLDGVRDLVSKGGAAVVQDEATSIVWGMPGAVARAGLAHAVLPLPDIGPKIRDMLGLRT